MSAPVLSSHITRRPRAGFSLITASIILTVAALVYVSMLPGDNGQSNQRVIDNAKKLERVEEAMRAFMAKNGRRPCPADGSYAFNTANFGVEAANPGTCTGNTPAAPLGPDVGTGYIVGGTIPTKTLGLPDEYAVDQFGHRFGYAVDIRATSNTACPTITTGGINIKNTAGAGGSVLAKTMYAYISFGKSGYGAYPASGSAAGPANRINSGSTDGDMQTNAGVDAHFPGASAFTYSTTNWTNTLVQKAAVAPTASDTGFDDMVWYRNDDKNICSIGPITKGPGFRIDGTAAYPNLGNGVATGDINGDGIKDLVIVANNTTDADNGYLIVVYGTTKGFPDPLPVSSLNGSNGFILSYSVAADHLGTNLDVGNFSSNSHADILVGAGGAAYSFATAGAAYVIFGGPTMVNGTAWSTCPCALTAGGSVINGTNGFRIDGAAAADVLGYNGDKQLQFADVNDDGNLDIILGDSQEASNGAVSGSVWVIYGNGAGKMKDGTSFAQTQTLALGTKPIDGTNGYRLDGATAGDWLGYSIAVADFNGDGYKDLIIDAYKASYGAASSGSVYVIYGTGVNSNILPSTTVTASSGKTCGTVASATELQVGQTIVSTIFPAGTTITAMGVACGSGFCAAVPTCMTTSAAASGAGPVALNLSSSRLTSGSGLIDGTHGFRLDGATASDFFGNSLTAGNFSSSSKADLLIGALSAYNGALSGSAYVIYGGSGGVSGVGKWSDGTALAATQTVTSGSQPINATNGFRIDGGTVNERLGGGADILAIGDLNGDGHTDLVIGGKNASYSGVNSGSVYVIYGNGAGRMKDGTAFAATQSLSAGSKPIDGSNGFRLDGRVASEYTGTGSVGPCIVDLNNDGKSDLIIGASYNAAGGSAPYYGSVWVLYGSYIPLITTSTYALSNLCKGNGC